MLSPSRIRIHGAEEESRHQLVSALWNAGILTVVVLTLAVLFFGVLAIRAT
jgi:hypothetical protein